MNEYEFQKALEKALSVCDKSVTLDSLRFWLIQQLEEELDFSLFSPRRSEKQETAS